MRHRLTAVLLASLAAMVAACSDSGTGPAAPTIAGRWAGATNGVVFRMYVDSVADNGAGGNLRGWFVDEFTNGVTPGDSSVMLGRVAGDSVVVEYHFGYGDLGGTFRGELRDGTLHGLVRSDRLALNGLLVTLTRQ